MEVAALNFSGLRIVRKFFLVIQESSWVPAFIRSKLLKWGGVNLGEPCFVGSHVSFDSLRPDLITIGKGCCITSGTKIITHFLNPDEDVMYYGEVKIGEHVFIGMNVLIVNAVSIGDLAVVGAGSVVLKDIPAGEIWAGNPARFIRKRNKK